MYLCNMYQWLIPIALILVYAIISGCSIQGKTIGDIVHYPRRVLLPDGYKRDIPQGNIITSEVIALLQPGMSKNDVIALLGTPTVQTPFRNDSWIYLNNSYYYRDESLYQKITLTFNNDILSTITSEGIIPDTTADNTLNSENERRENDNTGIGRNAE